MSLAALILLNEINVSRNSNKGALLMKADQIIAMRGRLKRRELRRKSRVRKKKRVGLRNCIVVLPMNQKYVYLALIIIHQCARVTLQDATSWLS